MMGEVKLSSALPKSVETNGLGDMADGMAERPDSLHVAVVVFDTRKVTVDTDTGVAVPTARIRRIEPIHRSEDRQRLESLVTRAFEERTGKTVLPLELEDELRAAFTDGDDQ